MNTEISEALKNVVNKAWNDDGFRANLVNDPKSALNEMGHQLPGDLDLVVTDQTDPNVAYINIPNEEQFKAHRDAQLSDMELSDEQLEAVSGGEIVFFAPTLIGGALFLGGAAGFGMGMGYVGKKVSNTIDGGW